MSNPGQPTAASSKPSPIAGHVLFTDKSGKIASINPANVTSVETTDGGNVVITLARYAVTLLADIEQVLSAFANFSKGKGGGGNGG